MFRWAQQQAHLNAEKHRKADASKIHPPPNLKLPAPPAPTPEDDAARWERIERGQQQAAQLERRAATLNAAREASKVPRRYVGARLDGNFPGVEKVPDKLRKLSDRIRRLSVYQPGRPPVLADDALLALVGKYRTGKTWVASALVNEVVEQGISAHAGHFTSTYLFFQAFKDAMSPAAKETPGQVYQRYLRFDVLVLDEITVRSDTEWENVTLRQLLTDRHNWMRTTVALGNVESKQFRDAVGDALVERFVESGRIGLGGIIDCDWDLQLKRQPKGD